MSPLVVVELKEFLMVKARTKVPKTAAVGDVITVKVLANHIMESGHRIDETGHLVPRKIITKFKCVFNGDVVFSCDLGTGVATNPFFEFRVKVQESGTFKFTWTDDDEQVIEAEESIEVT